MSGGDRPLQLRVTAVTGKSCCTTGSTDALTSVAVKRTSHILNEAENTVRINILFRPTTNTPLEEGSIEEQLKVPLVKGVKMCRTHNKTLLTTCYV